MFASKMLKAEPGLLNNPIVLLYTLVHDITYAMLSNVESSFELKTTTTVIAS